VVVGFAAAGIGVIGGLATGGSVIEGDLRADISRLTFIILPVIALLLFVFATMRDEVRPAVATSMYGLVVLLIAAQLFLPAL
jgi:hypothetical protein